MSDTFDSITQSTDKYQEQSRQVIEKILAAAQPGAVYSQPITSGDYTVITACEVAAGGGFGYGIGGDTSVSTAGEVQGKEQPQREGREHSGGAGGGGGGGGGSSGRPVAAIIIGPEGVRVKPVVDVTKLGLAALTTVGAMLMMLGRMRRMHRS